MTQDNDAKDPEKMTNMPKTPKFLQRNLSAACYHMCRLGTPLPSEAERMLRDGLHRWADVVRIQRASARKSLKKQTQASRLPQMRKELSKLKQSVKRHKKPDHGRTERLINALPEDTKAILNGAFKSRIYLQVEDFDQINFANPEHRQTLLDAIEGMRHLKINTKLAPASAKLTAEWQVLYDLLSGDTYRKSELSRFMRYCSNQGIPPGSVSDAVSDSYLSALVRTQIC